MKKLLKTIAAILCLGAMFFLAGEWPEDTPRKKVVTFDGGAIVVALVSGLYLKRTEDRRNG